MTMLAKMSVHDKFTHLLLTTYFAFWGLAPIMAISSSIQYASEFGMGIISITSFLVTGWMVGAFFVPRWRPVFEVTHSQS